MTKNIVYHGGEIKVFGRGETQVRNIQHIAATTTVDEARERLDAILSDRLLWFNPYRVADRELLACAERGKWSPFPSLTQMMVFHFKDIREILARQGTYKYDGIFLNVGNLDNETHFSVSSLTYPMSHMVTGQHVWALVNGRHLVSSNLDSIVGKNLFVSHAIRCCRINGGTRQAYRMHRLYGCEAKRAATVRESMCAAKLAMLNEVLCYPVHPDYLGNPCQSFDFAGPIRQAMASIRRFPTLSPPTIHIIR